MMADQLFRDICDDLKRELEKAVRPLNVLRASAATCKDQVTELVAQLDAAQGADSVQIALRRVAQRATQRHPGSEAEVKKYLGFLVPSAPLEP